MSEIQEKGLGLILRYAFASDNASKDATVRAGIAQTALLVLKEAVFEEIKQHPDGIKTSVVENNLDIFSDQNYLTWSLIQMLVNEGKVRSLQGNGSPWVAAE